MKKFRIGLYLDKAGDLRIVTKIEEFGHKVWVHWQYDEPPYEHGSKKKLSIPWNTSRRYSATRFADEIDDFLRYAVPQQQKTGEHE